MEKFEELNELLIKAIASNANEDLIEILRRRCLKQLESIIENVNDNDNI